MRRVVLALAILSIAACGSNSSSTNNSGNPDGGGGGGTLDAPGGSGTPDGGSASCGTCPSGYTCGSANGHPVCRAPSGVPLFDHVFVIVMENTSLATLQGANLEYIKTLTDMSSTASDYHGVSHPSLPNYVAMISGDPQGITCDCQPTGGTCPALCLGTSSCGCGGKPATHLGDQFDTAGISWKNYAENMGTACNVTGSSPYAPKHVPFLYFDDVTSNSTYCQEHVVDYSNFATDLGGQIPRFVFITPNLTDDMHDGNPPKNLQNGADWLQKELPAILGSDAYKHNGALFIVWDECDLDQLNPDAPIPFFLMSPLAKSGFVSSTKVNHYSLLATWEDGLGLDRLGGAAQATPLVDMFPNQ